MSNTSKIGLSIILLALLPFIITVIAEALGAAPHTGCGQVVIAVVGLPIGFVIALIGLFLVDEGAEPQHPHVGDDEQGEDR
jgi:hypothetical protein